MNHVLHMSKTVLLANFIAEPSAHLDHLHYNCSDHTSEAGNSSNVMFVEAEHVLRMLMVCQIIQSISVTCWIKVCL